MLLAHVAAAGNISIAVCLDRHIVKNRMTHMYKAQLRWQPIAILLALALIWGANMASIKIGAREIAPLFMATLRSLVASACLYVWMKAIGMDIFPSKGLSGNKLCG